MKLKTGLMLAGVAGGLYMIYQAKKQATHVVTKTLNPASAENIVYSNTPNPIKNGLNSFWGALDSVGLLPR